jgi:hypothetical protein
MTITLGSFQPFDPEGFLKPSGPPGEHGLKPIEAAVLQ